ncbi:hypothetical protein ACVBEQ_22375, partial [Nakamurella sp. GG22]
PTQPTVAEYHGQARIDRDDHPDIAVILLSSYDEAEFADLTDDCGAAAYVSKSSFGPDRLAEEWAAVVSRRRSGGSGMTA